MTHPQKISADFPILLCLLRVMAHGSAACICFVAGVVGLFPQDLATIAQFIH